MVLFALAIASNMEACYIAPKSGADFIITRRMRHIMTPLQDIILLTRSGNTFQVNLIQKDKHTYACDLACHGKTDLATFHADHFLRPLSTGNTPESAYEAFLKIFLQKTKDDPIIEINNPCNTELIGADKLKVLHGETVIIKINGKQV